MPTCICKFALESDLPLDQGIIIIIIIEIILIIRVLSCFLLMCEVNNTGLATAGVLKDV